MDVMISAPMSHLTLNRLQKYICQMENKDSNYAKKQLGKLKLGKLSSHLILLNCPRHTGLRNAWKFYQESVQPIKNLHSPRFNFTNAAQGGNKLPSITKRSSFLKFTPLAELVKLSPSLKKVAGPFYQHILYRHKLYQHIL